jgi:hypothetical protein
MSEVVQLKPIKRHFLIRVFIICSAVLIVAWLFSALPVLVSYRKITGP